ncbi:hypothetical protein KJ762_14135 [bacterium]|nr:hypothetical protein [bacterium]MBU1065171.1 hypothetical protein [bacterium]MBU1635629.1 hypothetical protein [bacterium]MBU1874773.1 hypothetical protein [bacterium]
MHKEVFTLNILLLILISVFGLNKCDFFEEENYEMLIEDKIAMESFEDPVLVDTVIYTALPELNRWIRYYTKTIKIDTILTDPTPSDSFATDSLYYFYYSNSFEIQDSITFKIVHDMSRKCYIDTIYQFQDTVQSKNDSVQYVKDVNFTQDFNFDVVLTSFADGKVDTFLTQEVDSVLDFDEINSSVRRAGKSITQTLLTTQVTTVAKPNSTYLLFSSRKKSKTYFFFDDYVKVKLYETNGDQITEVNCTDDRIPLETSAGYFKLVSKTPAPVIKARFEYDLDLKVYLLEIITTDQTVDAKFRSVIIYEI